MTLDKVVCSPFDCIEEDLPFTSLLVFLLVVNTAPRKESHSKGLGEVELDMVSSYSVRMKID